MDRFPHLALPRKVGGTYKHRKIGGPWEVNPITLFNLSNRESHRDVLLDSIEKISSDWKKNIEDRVVDGLPRMPDPEVAPLFLQIDPEKFDIETLKSFGIEIVAEEEDGFIIGASSIDFPKLKEKIENFVLAEGKFKDKAAQLWEIIDGVQWRIEKILSRDLKEKWGTIKDDDILVVDVSVASYQKPPARPRKKKDEEDQLFEQRLKRWESKRLEWISNKSDADLERQDEFQGFLAGYKAELMSSIIGNNEDSFGCRLRISGKGLKDLVLNYQYLFDVVEFDPFIVQDASTSEFQSINPEVLAPQSDSPKICVIDSGIQEQHRLIAPAIDFVSSKSFVPGEAGVSDIKNGGGHGTRVAGAILYPAVIPRTGTYQLPCFIQNARVLISKDNKALLPERLYPPEMMDDVVTHFKNTRIFNMSITGGIACKTSHMSAWAAKIDSLMFLKDILFIVPGGNLDLFSDKLNRPGIREHIKGGRNYPNFLLEDSSRIGDPAQSSFALTVGSVCHEEFDDGVRQSFGKRDQPSCFSRSGLGLWEMIKPDVVEYGGDLVKEKNNNNNNPNISHESTVSPELVRATSDGGSAIGSDQVGTSFAAPRVTYIAAMLQKLYPKESVNLYRALIVQSARLPEAIFSNPSVNDIRHYGYGIPSLARAVENSEKRITLIHSGTLPATQAALYSVKIPENLRAPGEDFDVLVEVTLAYMAKNRRTRRRIRSYLSTWLSWESSKKNETSDQFESRVVKEMNQEQENAEDQDAIKWTIREAKDWSTIKKIRRQDSTLQKSWCVMKSYDLPEALSFAVVGHKGWLNDPSIEVPYSLAVSFEALGSSINVYESIRVENEIEIEQEISLPSSG